MAAGDDSAFSADGDEELDPRSINEALDDEEDDLELRATQVIQEKYSFASDEPNVPAEHGILERVECYNFMCHDRFYVELGPLINFIVGKNGSGKSAVLTAITLCLGGKASATNRGQSLKSFIKEGKEYVIPTDFHFRYSNLSLQGPLQSLYGSKIKATARTCQMTTEKQSL